MDVFTKQVSGVYELVYNFDVNMPSGEIIKSYTVSLDGTTLTTTDLTTSGIVLSYEKLDNRTVIVGVQNGVHESGYYVSVTATSNRNNVYERQFYLYIDEDDHPYSYEDFHYRIQLSEYDKAAYILPDSNYSFTYNKEYQITVNPGISGVFFYPTLTTNNYWFTSQYCPMFTTVTAVKLVGGPTIESFSNDTISRYIYKNSKDVIDLYNLSNGTAYSYYVWGCGPNGVPIIFKRYVECKTAYDIVILIDRLNRTGSSHSKTLGDMSIKYGGTPGKLDPSLVDKLRTCYEGALNSIGGVQFAVKGWYDTTKMYAHPTLDYNHNRIIRTVYPGRSNPSGPWEESAGWRDNTSTYSLSDVD